MPGKKQGKYVGEVIRFNKSLKMPLHNIKSILPINYTKYDILNLFIELYPYEWNSIEERYKIYKNKEDFLKKVGKKKDINQLYLNTIYLNFKKLSILCLKDKKNYIKKIIMKRLD